MSSVPWELTQGTNHYMPQNLPSARPRTMSNVHPALFPARRPSTVHSSDLFFVAPPPVPPPPLPPAPPRPNRHIRPTTAPNGPHPPTYRPPTENHPFHRSYTCPPPIPPKPSELQSMEPDPDPAPPLLPEPPPEKTKEIRSEEEELALALQISRSESKKQQPIISQEDEDLARALEESLKLADANGTLTTPLHIPVSSGERQSPDVLSVVPHAFEKEEEEEERTPVQFSPADPIPSPQTPTSSSTRLTLGSNGDSKVNGSGVTSKSNTDFTAIGQSFIDFGGPSDHYAQDEALARSLAADYPVTPVVNPDDEILARRLAQEEGSAPGAPVNKDVAQMRRNDAPSRSNGQPRPVSTYVTESDDYSRRMIIRRSNASLRGRSKSAMATLSTTRLPDIQDMPPPYEAPSSTSSTETPSTTSTTSSPRESPATEHGSNLNLPSIPRVNSSPTVTTPQPNASGSSPQLTPSPIASTSQSNLSNPSNHAHLAARNMQITDLSEEADSSTAGASSNPYISDDLLNGVSIGFDPPPMSAQLGTWNKALPTIISLPFGRSLPLHIQAPSWRHVLKLLARLPGTTIQATIEAMAETKTEHKLRTVIQFAKPHLASTEWRVILWFTLEHPVPSNVPGSARYANDVNMLPWSYTLTQPPQLLRGGPDSQLAKTYTVPVTTSLSFPKLPITCPDLAMYLHAAMEVSRRHINDSSSGVRKLAKMIDSCYTDETANPERRGVGNLFKRVMGRANNNNRRRGGNEDTYDLVTPFVADEWG